MKRFFFCRHATFHVYVGRPTSHPSVRGRDGADGRWGNVRFDAQDPDGLPGAIRAFRRRLLSEPQLLLSARADLRGRTLGCWCRRPGCPPGQPCHALDLAAVAICSPQIFEYLLDVARHRSSPPAPATAGTALPHVP